MKQRKTSHSHRKKLTSKPHSSPERLQKLLATVGLGSRRQIEQWIEEGRVIVNGHPAELGQKAGVQDEILVDGKKVLFQQTAATRVIAYHKPVGEVTSRRDEKDRPTVFSALPKINSGRWIAIGRLDLTTSGLLLFTNDGELANQLMHPSSELPREYSVRILGHPTDEQIKNLLQGVQLKDGPARFDTVRVGGGAGANRWYHVTLHEGRNREVRRLWESQGMVVSRLTRTAFGPVSLERGLRPGKARELSAKELLALRKAADNKQKKKRKR